MMKKINKIINVLIILFSVLVLTSIGTVQAQKTFLLDGYWKVSKHNPKLCVIYDSFGYTYQPMNYQPPRCNVGAEVRIMATLIKGHPAHSGMDFPVTLILNPKKSLPPKYQQNVPQTVPWEQARKPTGLIYIHTEDEECKIQYWNIKTNKVKVLYKPKTCARWISVNNKYKKIFLIYRKSLRVVSITPDIAVSEELTVPIKIDKVYFGPEVRTAGIHPDGSLLVHQAAWDIADGSLNHLWKFDGKEWEILESKICGRKGRCSFDLINNSYEKKAFLPYTRLDWNKDHNPFVVRHKLRMGNLREDYNLYEITDLYYEIEGMKTKISYVKSKYSEGRNTGIMGLFLEAQGKEAVQLSEGGYAHNIGRYLIIGLGAGADVVNIKTGKSVLGFLKFVNLVDLDVPG